MIFDTVDVSVVTSGDAIPPVYATDGAAGADVRAHVPTPIEIPPGESRAIPTGLQVEIPPGYEIQVRPRSGLALKYGITVLNTPGTIDADYRGEIKIILVNHSRTPFLVESGMRIAQLVLAPVVRANFRHAAELTVSSRGSRGFGHTGLS